MVSFCADQGDLEVSHGLRREPAALMDEVAVEALHEVEVEAQREVALWHAPRDAPAAVPPDAGSDAAAREP